VNQRISDFQQVFDQLADEGLLETGWEQNVRDVLVEEHNEQPWYVRVMVGFSAWLASWMLIGFVVGAAVVESEQATLIMGVILVVGAVFARCVSDNDFMTQMALAVSLAGEGLIVFAVYEISDSFEATMFSFIFLEAVLVAFYPDAVHRFLSSASIFGALAGLLYKWELQSLLHVIVIGGAAGFIAMVFYERGFLARGQGQLVLPVKWGVLFGQLGVLMLSTIYVLPELGRDFEFFPFRWVSTLGLGVLLLFLIYRLERSGYFTLARNGKAIVYGACFVLIVAVLKAPGLIMALLLLLLGFARSDRVLLGVAIGFFVVFLAAFFYGIEVTLLTKSLVLVAAGALLLVARIVLKHFVFQAGETESND
jgi:uncharacterized membrane protein